MKRFLGGLVGVLLVSVFLLSRTEWGRQQIGGTVAGWFSGHEAAASAPAEPAAAGNAPVAEAPATGGAQASSAPKPQRQIPPLPTLRPKRQGDQAPLAGGQFRLLVSLDRSAPGRPSGWSMTPARQLVYGSRVLYDYTDYLNSLFVLPKDISINVQRCGEVNMYWDPVKENIAVCDEMIEELGHLFADEQDRAAFRQRVLFATSYFMFHEVGHALIQEYGVKALGKQEDIADQIAVLLLLGNDQVETVGAGAAAFGRLAMARPKDVPVAFWDEHSLNEQRYYNLLCWVYGSNPDAFASLVSDNVLPAERAARCPGEYADAVDGFNANFGPHRRR